jgi:hypothetical protein
MTPRTKHGKENLELELNCLSQPLRELHNGTEFVLISLNHSITKGPIRPWKNGAPGCIASRSTLVAAHILLLRRTEDRNMSLDTPRVRPWSNPRRPRKTEHLGALI